MIANDRLIPWTDRRRPSAYEARFVCRIECRTCGYEPADQLALPRAGCPKCHGDVWQRLVVPAQLFADAAVRRPCKPKVRA